MLQYVCERMASPGSGRGFKQAKTAAHQAGILDQRAVVVKAEVEAGE